MIPKLYFILAQLRKGDLTNLPNKDGISTSTVPDLITVGLGIMGGIAFIAVVYGGLKYIWSRGNPQETAKAQNTILFALIGLVIAIFAVTIIQFVVGRT